MSLCELPGQVSLTVARWPSSTARTTPPHWTPPGRSRSPLRTRRRTSPGGTDSLFCSRVGWLSSCTRRSASSRSGRYEEWVAAAFDDDEPLRRTSGGRCWVAARWPSIRLPDAHLIPAFHPLFGSSTSRRSAAFEGGAGDERRPEPGCHRLCTGHAGPMTAADRPALPVAAASPSFVTVGRRVDGRR